MYTRLKLLIQFIDVRPSEEKQICRRKSRSPSNIQQEVSEDLSVCMLNLLA